MNKRIAFVIYSWGTSLIYIFALFYFATLPFLSQDIGEQSEFYVTLFRILAYYILFLLIYRSMIATLRATVGRLAKWHSKKEKNEDMEFVFIVETLLLLLTISICLIISFIEEFIQFNVAGRSVEIKDVLVSVISILFSAIVIYSLPVVGELEVWIREKFLK